MAMVALKNLSKLKNCDAHATYMVSRIDKRVLRQLQINLTCEPEFYLDLE